ncbi:MAG: prepilin peptidase, partial [Cyanobium sp.]
MPTLLGLSLPPQGPGEPLLGLVAVLAAVIGACVGSFLNVVAWRLPREESLLWPGSHCPRCGTGLTWFENVPVLSWLALGGRCRYCRAPISHRYPRGELLGAGLGVLVVGARPDGLGPKPAWPLVV